MHGTALGAAHVGMAGVAAGVARHRREPRPVAGVAYVVDQGPGAVQRRRPEVVGVPGDDIARAVAHPAADALDGDIREPALLRSGRHAREIILPGLRAFEISVRFRPFIEERGHVGDEVPHHRQVVERRDLQPAGGGDLVHVGAAGPARAAIHRHRARAAHADAAGETVGERGIEAALDVGDDVEHGLVLEPRHFEGLKMAGLGSTPDRDCKRGQGGHFQVMK